MSTKAVVQSVTLLAVHSVPAPVYQLLCCSTVLFKVLCYKTKNVVFIFLCFLMCYLCEKYHKPITVQYYVIDCVSWVARLTLLNL